MTNKKATKRALALSIISMLICVVMLAGTTFAWFTDSVTSGVNQIVAGNLDIEVEYTLDGENWDKLDDADRLFQKGLWEPGHTEVVALKITNKGSLALKYAASMNIANETVGKTKDGKDIVLSDILTVSTLTFEDAGVDPVFGINIAEKSIEEAFKNENGIDYGSAVPFKSGNVLEDEKYLFSGVSQYIVIKVDMAETVGNEANHNGKDVPSIEFGINVIATQYTHEEDSFDNQYDKDAIYYDVLATTDAELKAAIIDPEQKVIAVKGDLTYDWGGDSYENSKALYMKGKTITGYDANSSITFAGYGSANPITDVTLKDITVKDKTVGDNEGSWEHGYLEFVSLNAQNVVFADTIMLDGNSTLVNCTMSNNTSSWYGIWINGGNTVIKNCTFDGTRSIKIHEAYDSDVESVVIDNCEIGKLSEKPGVVIGTLNADTAVSITNSTFINCQAGDQGKYKYESDTDIETFNFVDENNTVLSSVSTAEELSKAIANGGDIVLESDIKITDQTVLNTTASVLPAAFVINHGKPVTLDLNGHSIIMEPMGTQQTSLLFVHDTDVTIKGEGVLEQQGMDNSYTIWAKGKSTVTIEGGKFVSNTEDKKGIMLYASGNTAWDATDDYATINVYGGEFSSTSTGDPQYYANVMNHGVGKINYYGGTFNWNPAQDVQADDRNHIKVADGYHSVDNGNGTWSVVAD